MVRGSICIFTSPLFSLVQLSAKQRGYQCRLSTLVSHPRLSFRYKIDSLKLRSEPEWLDKPEELRVLTRRPLQPGKPNHSSSETTTSIGSEPMAVNSTNADLLVSPSLFYSKCLPLFLFLFLWMILIVQFSCSGLF